MQRYDIFVVTTAGSRRVTFPRLRDVATREDLGFSDAWMAGEDGSLWHHGRGLPPGAAGQVPSPGGMARLAVALDGAVWAVTGQGNLWRRGPNGDWSRVTMPAGIEPLVDVAIHQGTVWVVRNDGAIWQTRDGKTFEERTFLMGITRLAGLNNGDLWGLSTHNRPLLLRRRLDGVWDLAKGGQDKTWVDISISTEGVVWLVASDGTMWTTTDGTGFLSVHGDNFAAVTAGGFEVAWAVKRDGTLWVWQPKPAEPLPPPPPPPPVMPAPPPPPPPGAVRPQLSVSTTGAGGSTVFKVTGSGFLANVEVTVRAARIGADGVFDFYWATRSSPNGSISIDLPIPCVSGLVLSFSANDGRPDAADLTNRFWSNTFPRACP